MCGNQRKEPRAARRVFPHPRHHRVLRTLRPSSLLRVAADIELASACCGVYIPSRARERRALTPFEAATAMDPKLIDTNLTIEIVSDVV